MELPNRLYKYQSLSIQSLKNLKRNCIYFNDPNNFNDPYDTTQKIEVENINTEIVKHFIPATQGNAQLTKLIDKLEEDSISKEELIELILACSIFSASFYEEVIQNLGLAANTTLNEMGSKIRDLSLNFEKIKEVTKQSLFSNVRKMINNVLETERGELFKNIGVACFSEKCDDILMWSYYTDGHKGFCLEFDTSYEPFNKSHKVEYVPNSIKVDPIKVLFEENNHGYIIESYLATKYIDWKHEQEWRVIHKEKNKEYIYKPNALSGVYFGAKIDFTDLEIISLIVKGQNPNAKFYRMKKIPGEFKVIREEISYASFQEAKVLVCNQIESYLKSGITDIKTLLNYIKIPASEEQKITIIEAILDDIKLKKEGRK